MNFCPKCGAKLEGNTKFCGSCGAPIEQEAMQPAGAAPESGAANSAPESNVPAGDTSAQSGIPQSGGFIPGGGDGGNFIPTGGSANMNAGTVPAENNGGAAAAKKPNAFVEKIKANPIMLAVAGGALVVLIVLIVIIANITKYQKIDAKDLFKVEFEGINTCGEATAELNCYEEYYYSTLDAADKLKDTLGDDYADLIDDFDYEDELDDMDEDVSPYFSLKEETFLDAWSKADDKSEANSMRKALMKTDKKGEYKLKCKIENNKNLKNGDKVKCVVTYDEEYLKENNIKLKNTEFEVEVKGLDDGQEIDFFDGVEVTFTGIDGKGYASVDTYNAMSMFSYDYDTSSNLSNGDKFTITARCYYDMTKAGDKYWFKYDDEYYITSEKEQTKEYEVSGLTEVQEIDPFEGLAFETQRGTPFLKITDVNTDGCDSKIKSYVRFEIVNGDSLDQGDKFTVKAIDRYGDLEDEGYKLSGTPDADGYVSKEFTVDASYAAYVTAANGAEAMNSFQSSIDDKIQDLRKSIKGTSYLSGVDLEGKVESIDSFEKVDTYVAFNNKTNYDSFGWSEHVNRIINVYKVEVTVDSEKKEKDKFYAVIYTDDVIYDGENYTGGSFSSSYYDDEAALKKGIVDIEGYTVKKCGDAETERPEDSSSAAQKETTTTTAASADSSSNSDKDTTASTTTKGTDTEIVP